MTLAPRISGSYQIESPGPEFLEAFRRRVAAGLISGRPHPRSNYLVAESGPGHLRVQAASWWTAIAVGLNDVELRVRPTRQVSYEVRYWRWATYVLGLSGVLGGIGLVLLLSLDLPGYIAKHPEQMIPGLSNAQNELIAWGMVLFWGFVWPWLLIALHKGPLRRLVEGLIREVDVTAEYARRTQP